MLVKARFFKVSLALCWLVFLSGCDQVRQAVGDMITPPNSGEVAIRVRALAADGKIPKAIQVGEDFLLNNEDSSGDLHRQLAQLHAMQGDTMSALRHIQQSTSGAQATQEASTLAQPSAASKKPAPLTADALASVEGASAQVGPSGIEVRAGDLRVKISK